MYCIAFLWMCVCVHIGVDIFIAQPLCKHWQQHVITYLVATGSIVACIMFFCFMCVCCACNRDSPPDDGQCREGCSCQVEKAEATGSPCASPVTALSASLATTSVAALAASGGIEADLTCVLASMMAMVVVLV